MNDRQKELIKDLVDLLASKKVITTDEQIRLISNLY